MRAIIDSSITTTPDGLRQVFVESKTWWPPYPQDDPLVTKERNDILTHVAEGDRELVERTYQFMIYHHRTKSWGLVNCPQAGIAEYRIRNQDSLQLRKACENFLETLTQYNAKHHVGLEFAEIIRVLEPNSADVAYYGEVLPAPDFKSAKHERSGEWRIGKSFLLATIILTLITIPPMERWVDSFVAKDWVTWGAGFLGRCATSALVTAVVSFIAVVFHWYELRRVGQVRWLFKTSFRSL
jgi:hypothetical protein